MSDTIRSQLRKLQHQLDDATRAIDEMSDHGAGMKRQWRRVSKRTSELGREAEGLARQHPAATSLIVVGVIALAAAYCFYRDHH
ncbi:MAG TPA: hypothetical protein VK035_10970 [Kiloniellales bacterium]|nr:hypothetical protein [Kiloniellales bacterium]